MNKYFELIEDSDLNGEDSVQSWVWICPTCRALFKSKAIHNRTIFPFFGYHPADGNCKIITEETAREINRRAYNCDCKESVERVEDVKTLKAAILSHKEVQA